MSDHVSPDCPLVIRYRAAWNAWTLDVDNRELWARVNAELDQLETQPPPDGISCPCPAVARPDQGRRCVGCGGPLATVPHDLHWCERCQGPVPNNLRPDQGTDGGEHQNLSQPGDGRCSCGARPWAGTDISTWWRQHRAGDDRLTRWPSRQDQGTDGGECDHVQHSIANKVTGKAVCQACGLHWQYAAPADLIGDLRDGLQADGAEVLSAEVRRALLRDDICLVLSTPRPIGDHADRLLDGPLAAVFARAADDRAKAWDEGYAIGCDDGYRDAGPTPNPYSPRDGR